MDSLAEEISSIVIEYTLQARYDVFFLELWLSRSDISVVVR